MGTPPVAEVYQVIVEPVAVADAVNGTITASAHFVAEPELVGGAGAGLIVRVIFVLVELVQVPLSISP